MRVFRQSKFQRHLLIPLMLTCFLSGCYRWSVQPAAVVRDGAPEQVRLMLSRSEATASSVGIMEPVPTP
jgi:hypothetical protein